MASYPVDLRYTKEHEWVYPQGASWRVGITSFAQTELGDVVMVDLPKVGATFAQGDAMGTIESVKAVSEVYAPISGKITAVNTELEAEPELVNTDPHGDGWLMEIEPTNRAELDALMTADAYYTFTTTPNSD